jgi:hypothetical protein
MKDEPNLIALSIDELHRAGHIGNCNNCGTIVIDAIGLHCNCAPGKCDFHFSEELISQIGKYNEARRKAYQVVLNSIDPSIIKPPVTPM